MSKNTKLSVAFLTAAACFVTQLSAEEMQHESNPSKPGYGRAHRVPPAQPLGQKDDHLNFFVGASYTYWLPYNTGLAYAFGKNGPQGMDDGNVLEPVTQGVSGFKVSAGANLQHDGWHLRANYTWFLHNPGFRNNPNVVEEVDYVALDAANYRLQSSMSRYYIYFNRVDACINRNYFIGDYVVFRPWLGLLGTWDEQFLKFSYDAALVPTSTPITYTNHLRTLRQWWWGVGPYAGGEATYHIFNDFGLFIQSGAAILYANHESTIYQGDNVFAAESQNRWYLYNVEPMFEVCLGLRWEKVLEDVAFRVNIAWEVQTYLEHVSFPVYSDIAQNFVNYSMQGLTVGGRISF